MEQKPTGTAAPLTPPTADVASAFLDEAGFVARRREERIDRRMLGWLHLIDGAVVGAILSAVLVSMQSSSPMRQVPLLAVAALAIWMECASELRDRTGLRQSWFRSWSLPYLIVFVPTMVIALVPPGDQPSAFFVVLPLVISLVAFGTLAMKQWQIARGDEHVEPADPERFTGRVAISTAAFGVLIGALIWAVGLEDPIAGSTVALVLMCVLLGLTLAQRTWTWMPGLGQAWRWPQWTALVFAAVVFVSLVVVGARTNFVTIEISLAAGAAVFVVVLVAAFFGARNAR